MLKLMKAATERLEKILKTIKADEIDNVMIETELDIFPARLFVDYRGGNREIFDYNKESESFEYSNTIDRR